MSFERFISSDIYMFEHVGGYIECCGCLFAGWGITVDDDEISILLDTPRQALAHLDRHEEAGHDIGGARARIIKTYPDLDRLIDLEEMD